MSESKYQPITDNAEFVEQYQGLGEVGTELKKLVADYTELNEKFKRADLDFDGGEFDWWAVKENQLKNILIYVHKQLGEETFNLLDKIERDKRIQELWNKISDQRQLGIPNDPVLQELYRQVNRDKLLADRP